MARKIVVARCTECEDQITNGQTCSCGGIVVGYSGDVYNEEDVYYQIQSSKNEERRDVDGGSVLVSPQIESA